MGNAIAIINAKRDEHARAVAEWREKNPGEDLPSTLEIGSWFSEYVFRGTPRIGDWFCNVYASEANPHSIGMFIRRSNAMFEMTDCRGSFWRVHSVALVLIDPPADAPLVRRESTP